MRNKLNKNADFSGYIQRKESNKIENEIFIKILKGKIPDIDDFVKDIISFNRYRYG